MSDNPFMQNSLDNECRMLCRTSKQNCYFSRDKSLNITKYTSDIEAYNREVHFYLKFIGKHLFPDMNATNNTITYMVNNMTSLRSFLDNMSTFQRAKRYGIILNELLSFVNTFQKLQFVHGNLNIDNIFVEVSLHTVSSMKFYVIDLGHSTTFVHDNCRDFYSLEKSLSEYLEHNNKLLYLRNLVKRYTKSSYQ